MGVKQTQTEVTKRHANEIPMQDKKKGQQWQALSCRTH